jgi:hypothetical protein
LTIVADGDVNQRGLPIYLMTSSLPPCAALAAARAVTPGIFTITVGGDTECWPMYRIDGQRWAPIGCYVPITALRNGLSVLDLDLVRSSSLVLFESLDVVTDLRTRRQLAHLSDEQTRASIRSSTGSRAAIVRISDFVELELLEQRLREAA